MFKDTTAIEPLKIIAPPASPKPVTEDELQRDSGPVGGSPGNFPPEPGIA